MNNTNCPVCSEKLIVNFRDYIEGTLMEDELECPNRHYLTHYSTGNCTINVGSKGSSLGRAFHYSHNTPHEEVVDIEAQIANRCDAVRADEVLIERLWRDFWKPLVAPGGQLCLAQVKRELFDFHNLMDNTARVYCHVTGGAISKPMTDAGAVIQISDEVDERQCQDAVEEAQELWECPTCAKRSRAFEEARQEVVENALVGR